MEGLELNAAQKRTRVFITNVLREYLFSGASKIWLLVEVPRDFLLNNDAWVSSPSDSDLIGLDCGLGIGLFLFLFFKDP